MGLIKTVDGKRISVATINGYSVEKVRKAKLYLNEINRDRRNFPIEKIVEMYNDIKGTREKAIGCKPCQATKYYNGLQNYVTYGEITLITNGYSTKEELDPFYKPEKVEPKEEEPKEEIIEEKPAKKAGRPKKTADVED